VEVPEIQEDVLNRYAARESSFLNLIKFYFWLDFTFQELNVHGY
jgi:hypothetical protein